MASPSNLEVAKWRLASLEKKLMKDPELKSQYSEKIKSYLDKGYAAKLSLEELKEVNQRTWFLPHFPVRTDFKPKPRLVFYAAAKAKNKSLNSFMLPGPDIYVQLIHVLLNQRIFAVSVIVDIEEMFHQVEVRKEDRAALRFLWRDCNPSAEPDVFEMSRMIFGSTSSPYQVQ